MKRLSRSTVDTRDLRQQISNALREYIKYELWPQDDYYKQIKKQFTVNGRKYVVKNNSKGRLLILNPEGEDLYGYQVPSTLYSETTDDMASLILSDAYGDDIDLDSKRVYLNVRSGYTYYGSNSGGDVTFGRYVDLLRNHCDSGDPDARYAAVLIKAWWSSHDEKIIFSDNAEELIRQAQRFIEDGAMTPSGQGSMGEDEYRFYADVIDTETGKEIYFDKSESVNRNS